MHCLNFLCILFAAAVENTEIEVSIEEEVETVANLEYSESNQNILFFPNHQDEDTYTFEDIEKHTHQKNTHIFVYGQLLPGGGLAIRTNKNFGFEANASLFLPGIKFSASALKYFSNKTENSWYAGGGLGVVFTILFLDDGLANFYAPVFIGYEGKRFFSDLGLDVIFHSTMILPLPVLRCGLRF